MSPRGTGPMGGAHGVDAKAKNFKGTMLKLAEYASPFKLTIILVFIFAACSAGFSILGPKILGWATTKLFEGLMAYSMGTGFYKGRFKKHVWHGATRYMAVQCQYYGKHTLWYMGRYRRESHTSCQGSPL